MPRIQPHTLETAPEQARPKLQQLQQKTGELLNIHAGMAEAPVVLAAYLGIQAATAEHGTIDARTQEAIALAVAAVDRCDYCQSAHTGAGRAAGLTVDQTVAIRQGEPIGDPRLEALLEVVRQATGRVGEVEDGTWKQPQDAGWQDAELAEAFVHIALNLYTNYWNHYAGTELNVPPAPGIG